MNAPFVSTDVYPAQWLRPTVEFLLASQRSDGEIPWFDGGHTDPWDHAEAAMGLSVAGELAAAERARARGDGGEARRGGATRPESSRRGEGAIE